jgi:hypothetical protein
VRALLWIELARAVHVAVATVAGVVGCGDLQVQDHHVCISTGHNSMVQLLFKDIKQEIRRHCALIDVIGDSTYTDQLGTYDHCGHEVDSCDCVVNMKRRMIVELFDFLCSVDVNLLKSRHIMWNSIVTKMEEFLLDEYLSDYIITIRSHFI